MLPTTPMKNLPSKRGSRESLALEQTRQSSSMPTSSHGAECTQSARKEIIIALTPLRIRRFRTGLGEHRFRSGNVHLTGIQVRKRPTSTDRFEYVARDIASVEIDARRAGQPTAQRVPLYARTVVEEGIHGIKNFALHLGGCGLRGDTRGDPRLRTRPCQAAIEVLHL